MVIESREGWLPTNGAHRPDHAMLIHLVAGLARFATLLVRLTTFVLFIPLVNAYVGCPGIRR